MWFVLVCDTITMETRGVDDSVGSGQLIGPFSTENDAKIASKKFDDIRDEENSDDDEEPLYTSFIFESTTKFHDEFSDNEVDFA